MDYTSIVLPTLTGSDKQISWATDLRSTFMAEAQRLRDGIEAGTLKWVAPQMKMQALEILDRIIPTSLAQATTASVWINNGLGQSAEKLFVNAVKKAHAKKS